MIANPRVLINGFADVSFYSRADTLYFEENPNKIGAEFEIHFKDKIHINVYDTKDQLILDEALNLTEYAKKTYGFEQNDVKIKFNFHFFNNTLQSMCELDEANGILFYRNVGVVLGNDCFHFLDATIDLGKGYKSTYNSFIVNTWWKEE